MEILKLTKDSESEIIESAIRTLKNGGLVVYPTETTYGIGADCENPDAISKLIAYKSKRDGKPLSVAVYNQETAEKYVVLNDTAKNVYKTFLPGPVTVISKNAGQVAPGVASSTGTLGIRIPKYPFTLNLLKEYGKGITATGANASYQKRPYTIQDIFDNISEKQKNMIDLVIDAGELPHNDPSTVIDTTLDDIVVTRFGDIAFTSKEQLLSKNVEDTKEIARTLISRYRNMLTYAPLIFALSGQMGAGKTQFAKGVATGLFVTETVTSPTYSLEQEYSFVAEGQRGLLVHIDTWKMDSLEDFMQLGVEKLLDKNAVIVIEWADRFSAEIQALSGKAKIVWISLEVISENERTITIGHPNKE